MIDLKTIAAEATIVGALGLPETGTAGGLGRGAWRGAPGRFLGPIDACIAATGPYGYVTGYVCI